ncbi:lipocalin-like domain-containing protein [Psychroserpens algicola]|uniref:Lipocalin-like domain-containing protein n=1 Tax=Psychroserpens algicola TaxID=1719034 RepID=A0ABT0H9U6_9FLAO|nr:lipocalin-like domain-containing protein [Psychroserpens algicola]MCK8481138.1 lipocalin-like domain-containing protein [Psychroserpens algicola]
MKTNLLISIVILTLLSACNSPKKEVTNHSNPLEGSWKMQEIHYIYTDTTYVGKPITYGTFVFAPKRYSLLYNPWTTERKAFDTLSKPTDAEIKAAFQSIVFNSGSYIYTDSTVTTTADMAKVPGFEGGQQFYTYTIKNDMLDIMMFDETYPDGNKPEWYGKLKVLFKMKKE